MGAIIRARVVTDVFDFEGSMLQPVERFFRAFGSRQTPYLRVSRRTARARAALAAHAGWRSVQRRYRNSHFTNFRKHGPEGTARELYAADVLE